MRLGIDARLYGLKHAGIGRYVQNLITELAKLDSDNHYTIFASHPDGLGSLPKHSQLIKADIRHYTLAEQTQFLSLINSHNLDLVHFPHFNVPLFYNRPFVVTIHDLLWHEKIGFRATTLNPLSYSFKYFGYRLIIKSAIKRAKKIITPTQHVADSISTKFNQPPNKLVVTYEAADPAFFFAAKMDPKALKQYQLHQPFVVYTGSLYPHKNVNTLISAVGSLENVQLAIVSARSVFQRRVQNFVKQKGLSSKVRFLGHLTDHQVVKLYKSALALVLPSQSEGFGLTGLEAMAAGLPVISSDHSVMREVYSNKAIYCDTSNPANIAKAIEDLQNNPKRAQQLSKQGRTQASKYSWTKMAKQTLKVYNQALKPSK